MIWILDIICIIFAFAGAYYSSSKEPNGKKINICYLIANLSAIVHFIFFPDPLIVREFGFLALAGRGIKNSRR